MLLIPDFWDGKRRRSGAATPLLVLAATTVSLFALSGCGGGGGGSQATPPSSVASAANRSASLSLSLTWPDSAALLAHKSRAFPVAANSLTITVTDATGFSDTQTLVRPPAGSTNTTVFANFFALAPGQATITATAFASTNGTGPVLSQTGSTVSLQTGQQSGTTLDFASPIVSVVLNSPATGFLRGTSVKVTPTATDDRGNTSAAAGTFVSSDPGVATVDTVTGNVVGVGIGTAVITFTEAQSGKTAQITVGVVGIQQISLTPANQQIAPGTNLTLSATGKDANGVIVQNNPPGAWTSSNTGIATVDASGKVTGVSAGVATISFTDTAFGVTGTTTVAVRGGDAQVIVQ